MTFHVGELVEECGYVVLRQLIRDCGHEGVIHSGACSVRQYEKTRGARRQQQQGGNFFFIQNGKSQIADVVHRSSLRGFIEIWCELNLVPERGLEPPLPCENQVLNLARLPIPPFGHKCGTWTAPLVARVTSFFILPADLTFVNELS